MPPALAIVKKHSNDTIEALETLRTVDGTRPRRETAGQLVAGTFRNSDGVDLDDTHGGRC